jgi:hypothetical protein
MLEANGRINLRRGRSVPDVDGPTMIKKTLPLSTLGTASAFTLALVAGRLVGRLSFREKTLAGLAGSFGVFVIAGQHDTWIEPASVAVLIGTFASVITLTSVMWFIQTGRLVFP